MGALPPNKCSCQLKHFVEGQNLPRRLMDKFTWQYYKLQHSHDQCCIPPARQGVGVRGDTRVGGGDIALLDISLENVVTDFYFPQ